MITYKKRTSINPDEYEDVDVADIEYLDYIQVFRNGVFKGAEAWQKGSPVQTHRTDIFLDEFFDLFTEAKDNAIHASTNAKIKRARRSLNYSKHRPFDVSTDKRIAALLNAAVTDGIITPTVRITIKKGVPL